MRNLEHAVAATLIIASLGLSSCGALGGQPATPTASATPTITPRPTHTPTAGPSPTPTPVPTGITAEKQPDGTTLVTDHDVGYQFKLAGEWQTFLPEAGGWASVLQSLPYDAEPSSFLKSAAEEQGLQGMRLFALDTAPEYIAAGAFPTFSVVAAYYADEGSCMPVDFRLHDLKSRMEAMGITTAIQLASNAGGVEIGTEEFLALPGGLPVPPLKGIMFDATHANVALYQEIPEESPDRLPGDWDSVQDTVRLLPAGVSPTGVELVEGQDGSWLVVDHKLGYQFELDESWHPIVVTEENAGCLNLGVLQVDWALNPERNRLIVLRHDAQSAQQRLDLGYAMHLEANWGPDVEKGTSLDDLVAEAEQWPAFEEVTGSEVSVNSRGVEIGTLECVRLWSGHTFTDLRTHIIVAYFHVGDDLMHLALASPGPIDEELASAFATVVDSIEVSGQE